MIGIGKIIPGVSGAMIAITFGLYEKMIHAINHLFKKENFFFLFPIGLGVLFAILFTSKWISFLLDNYYLATMLLFIGLITGGIPSLFQKTNCKSNKNILLIIVSFLILLSISFLSNSENQISIHPITHFFMGIVEAFTMIVPGISGTALFILFGYYEFFIDMLSTCMTNILYYLPILLPFSVGMIVGVFGTSKLMDFFFCKYTEEIYALIIGFAISSIFLLLKQTLTYNYSKIEIAVGLFLMIIGYFLQKHLEKKEE